MGDHTQHMTCGKKGKNFETAPYFYHVLSMAATNYSLLL